MDTSTYQDKLPYEQVAGVIAEGGILITVVLPVALALLAGSLLIMLLAWKRGREWNDVGVAMRDDLDPKYLEGVELDEKDEAAAAEDSKPFDQAG